MFHLTQAEYENLLRRMGGHAKIKPLTTANASNNDALSPTSPRREKAKYRNKRVYIYSDGFVSTEKADGHGDIVEKFDSIKEYQRCLELRVLEQAGMISSLDTQKPLIIQDGFRGKDGVWHRAITYRADFAYIENGVQIIEDVKAFDKRHHEYRTTEAFNLKWKLLKAKYPDYIFRVY